jgi:hypothetical protein
MDRQLWKTLFGESVMTKEPKDILLTLRISKELDFQLNSYCLNHVEQNKSQFIRAAIRDRLNQQSPGRVKSELRSFGDDRVLHTPVKNKHDALQEQWKREAEEDRMRQRGVPQG